MRTSATQKPKVRANAAFSAGSTAIQASILEGHDEDLDRQQGELPKCTRHLPKIRIPRLELENQQFSAVKLAARSYTISY